jgi:hypothetical protein
MSERDKRKIGSSPDQGNKIARGVKNDQTSPYGKGKTHPTKDEQ